MILSVMSSDRRADMFYLKNNLFSSKMVPITSDVRTALSSINRNNCDNKCVIIKSLIFIIQSHVGHTFIKRAETDDIETLQVSTIMSVSHTTLIRVPSDLLMAPDSISQFLNRRGSKYLSC